MSQVEKHFNSIASQYENYKKNSWYYYQNIKELYQKIIPPGQKVLEIGCGTGDIISFVNPQYGVGIDISPAMISLAKQKYPMIYFKIARIENFKTEKQFDYIFLADVVEHLEDIPAAIVGIRRVCNNETRVIFTYANPLWEPILIFLEKMGLKMPEGPHYRIPFHKLKKILMKYDFKVLERGWKLLVPAYIPGLSNFINRFFYHVPLLKRLGMLEYIIIKKK